MRYGPIAIVRRVRFQKKNEAIGLGAAAGVVGTKLGLDVAPPLGVESRRRLVDHHVSDTERLRDGAGDLDVAGGHVAGREIARGDAESRPVARRAQRKENLARILAAAERY